MTAFSPPAVETGDSCQRFAVYAGDLAGQAPSHQRGATWFVLELARQAANVDFGELRRPRRFWRRLRQEPPVCFGPHGFRPALTDDFHPARHYSAFLLVGFLLPNPLGAGFAWLWERVEGWLQGSFSPRDVGLARLAVRHGRAVRHAGPAALPALIRRDICGDK